MIPMLEFVRDGNARFCVRLSRSETLVGRGERCDVTLPEDHVSRVHFVVRRDGTSFSLLDRSRNGTLVNGEAVETAELHVGDEISLPPWQATSPLEQAVSKETAGPISPSTYDSRPAATAHETEVAA